MPKALSEVPLWQRAIRSAAEPQRAQQFLDQLAATTLVAQLRKTSAEQARILAALFSGSQFLSPLLLAHPDWLASSLSTDRLLHPRREQGLRREVNEWLQPALRARDYAGAFAKLCLFKQREMLRIAARDLARLSDAPQIIQEISTVADVCLSTVLQLCRLQLIDRFGEPWHQDADGRWHPTEFAVLGLGKLGGEELNYSSDVDVIFVYSEEGNVFKEPPRRATVPDHGMSNHQFFKRLAEAFIAEIARSTSEGKLFRIDLRLRPEGDSGPLVRSLGSYENYYSQWGQTWERMMLIKARCVAGDAALGAEFMEMVQPFRYPRSHNEGVLREIAAMKSRIETEVVKSGEIDRNVKLGYGGIREIEFIAQTLQLLNAGRIPFLQGEQTLPTLQKLVQYKLLGPEEAEALTTAYCFLRDVEHRLQMENNLQTHTIPTDAKARERLAGLMGFEKLSEFETVRQRHHQKVRLAYDKLLNADQGKPTASLPRDFQGAEVEWKTILAQHCFQDVDKSWRLLNQFANGPGYGHVSTRTTDLAFQLISKLFALCRTAPQSAGRPASAEPSQVLSDPDRVLARLDSFISAYGARATLFETWASNASLFELLLLLFDRSEFLAEIAIRTPDLVDELVLSGRLRRTKTAAETLADLRLGLRDKDQRMWIRRYHQAEFMRLGLRDILGLANFDQNLIELSALADACLQYALAVVLRKHKLKVPPFVIVGLGKLGGQELGYGSDLDIVFVADSKTKKLPKLQRLAVEVMELLSSPTEHGVAFVTDARLRPDGEKGLLVNTLHAYEEYYRHRAQLWEIQSLTRTRPVAGNLKLGEHFQRMVAALTDFSAQNVASGFSSRLPTAGRSGLAAYSPDWKNKIAHMRQRIEKERTPAGQDALAIKTGAGGLMDAEFIAQALCLAHDWHEANTLRALQRARDTQVLAQPQADRLIENYRQLRRIEGILRRWSFEGEVVLPSDPAPYYRVSVRCGFPIPEAFREALAACRRAIREVYGKVFPA